MRYPLVIGLSVLVVWTILWPVYIASCKHIPPPYMPVPMTWVQLSDAYRDACIDAGGKFRSSFDNSGKLQEASCFDY